MSHTPVLLHEVVEGVRGIPEGLVVDGTLGDGGHSKALLDTFPQLHVLGIDQDKDAVERVSQKLASYQPRFQAVCGNFRKIDTLVPTDRAVSGVLLDIGLSSIQFDDSGRGFSFQKDEPLVMSFKKDPQPEDLTARDIVNTWEEESIRSILEGYGEEQFAYRIAKGIVRARELAAIETTSQLVDIVLASTPKFYHHRRIHPATKTFQALRIAVNDELGALEEGMKKSFSLLVSGGRLLIISFHSLEDRLVKRFFKGIAGLGSGVEVTKKPIVPTDAEIQQNPRARSSKLRIIQKI